MNKERGQSLILGTVFLASIVMSMLYLFNVSQQNLNKTKLQTSADATSLSGAQLLARDLNFKAYTNRAMVANHVAVAQYVGLSSWGNMAQKGGENLATVTSIIPIVGQITAGVEEVLTAINEVLQPATEAAVVLTDIVNTALSTSQMLMNSASMVALVETSNKVLNKNDPDAYVDVASAVGVSNYIANDWVDFQGRFDRDDDSGRYDEHFNLITNSVDPFTEKRSFNWDFPFTIQVLNDRLKTKQAGGTELFKNGSDAEVWSAMDTLGFHFETFSCSWRCKWRGGEIPTGWGASHAGSDKSTDEYTSNSYYGSSRATNGTSSGFASDNETAMNSAYSGLQSFYDIKSTNRQNVAPMLTVVISKDIEDIRTSKKLKVGTENKANTKLIDIDIEEEMDIPRDRITVLSKAKIYFFRDSKLWERPDSKWEYGNMYNPYWQVTLNDTTKDERRIFSALALLL
ncbi:Tad domain-containing protein [Pseudoalteromonas sp. TB64]|uniref:Tad domain-containing protein n=1 Tax=Pseudoalteromonas sp. TB64 TaxID=1938600 RepID=UPI00041A3830|nr:Tad domain-containing protein [Pseudoalteromonas sp. TB64]